MTITAESQTEPAAPDSPKEPTENYLELSDGYDDFRFDRGEHGSVGAYGTVRSPETVKAYVATLTPTQIKIWHDWEDGHAYLSPGFAILSLFIRWAAEDLNLTVDIKSCKDQETDQTKEGESQ